MGRPINQKCQECSKVSFRWITPEERPKCYSQGKCQRKRNYYRYLDNKREYQRRVYHYHRYCTNSCNICQGTNELQVHHIQSQINGGESTKDNCMTLCLICHRFITKYYQAIRGLSQATTIQ